MSSSTEAGGFASITSGVISVLGAPHVPTGGERGLTAIDNVELCPVYDPSGVTARLVWEVLSQMLYAHARVHLGA